MACPLVIIILLHSPNHHPHSLYNYKFNAASHNIPWPTTIHCSLFTILIGPSLSLSLSHPPIISLLIGQLSQCSGHRRWFELRECLLRLRHASEFQFGRSAGSQSSGRRRRCSCDRNLLLGRRERRRGRQQRGKVGSAEENADQTAIAAEHTKQQSIIVHILGHVQQHQRAIKWSGGGWSGRGRGDFSKRTPRKNERLAVAHKCRHPDYGEACGQVRVGVG